MRPAQRSADLVVAVFVDAGRVVGGSDAFDQLAVQVACPAADVGALCGHVPARDVVAQVVEEALFEQPLFDAGLEDREAGLDALEEVAAHPVGARCKEAALAASFDAYASDDGTGSAWRRCRARPPLSPEAIATAENTLASAETTQKVGESSPSLCAIVVCS